MNEEPVNEPYEEIPTDLTLNVENQDFKTIYCLDLGYISPKACEFCHQKNGEPCNKLIVRL